MAKQKRQNMTVKRYEGLKILRKALTEAQGKTPTNMELSRISGISNTTVGRIINTKDFKEYQEFQSAVAHGKATVTSLKSGVPLPSGKPVFQSVPIPTGKPESQETIVLTRIAIALEGLLEAWQSGGKRRFGK